MIVAPDARHTWREMIGKTRRFFPHEPPIIAKTWNKSGRLALMRLA
jgi:hypothetical protein